MDVTKLVSKLFIYISDQNKFYHKSLRQSMTEQSATKLIQDINGNSVAPQHIKDALDSIKPVGMDFMDIKNSHSTAQPKRGSGAINYKLVYDQLHEKLPILFYLDNACRRITYLEKENKTVHKVEINEPKDFINLFYANSDLLQFLHDYYYLSELTQPYIDKTPFVVFLTTLATQQLMVDPKKLLKKEPSTISWDPDEYCFARIPIEKVEPGPCPTWDEFTSRLDHPELFKAWVWSIIEPTNTVRQVCWIRGGGQDGKSQVQKALEKMVGQSHVYAMKQQDLQSQYFLGNCYGKVLVSYPDCNNVGLLKHDTIKQITGGDSASIEQKYESAVSGTLRAKIFVHSNKNPRINPESRAQVTRLLKLELKPTKVRDALFEERLSKEIWNFLDQCKGCYDKYISVGGDNIEIPEQIYNRMIEDCSSDMYMYAKDFERKYMEYGPEHSCYTLDFNRKLGDYAEDQHMTADHKKFLMSELKDILAEKSLESPKYVQLENGEKELRFVGFKIKGA